MSLNLASFINRLPERTTNKAPNMTKTATNIQQSEKHQLGAINNDFLNDNEVDANIEVIGHHIYSSPSVIIVFLVMFALILVWRMCKRKKRHKICHFLCVRRCRYGQVMPEAPEPIVSNSTTGGARVENIPLNANGLVQLANQLALNVAVAQVQSWTASTANLVPQSAADTTTED